MMQANRRHMASQGNKRSNKKKANEKEGEQNGKFFGSGGDKNERQMAINVNCKDMRFVMRNLVDVDDVSPAMAP